jgi:hypothetical protein
MNEHTFYLDERTKNMKISAAKQTKMPWRILIKSPTQYAKAKWSQKEKKN